LKLCLIGAGMCEKAGKKLTFIIKRSPLTDASRNVTGIQRLNYHLIFALHPCWLFLIVVHNLFAVKTYIYLRAYTLFVIYRKFVVWDYWLKFYFRTQKGGNFQVSIQLRLIWNEARAVWRRQLKWVSASETVNHICGCVWITILCVRAIVRNFRLKFSSPVMH